MADKDYMALAVDALARERAARDEAELMGRATQLRLTQTKEKIRLVFAWIGPFAQNSAVFLMFDHRVMTRGDVIAAERFGFAPEVTEL